MRELTDRELVHRAQRGEASAIGELFSRYWRPARATAFGVTGEFASAEDAAAEALNLALASIHSLRDPDRFGSWLRTIVLRKARLRRQRADLPIDNLGDQLSDPNERADQALARIQLAASVHQAIRQLPRSLREAVALVYLEGYDSELAAQFLDIPASTLRRRLHDGRSRLRAAAQQILRGNQQVNDERERQIQALEVMIEKGELYQAFRQSLTLRPPANHQIETLLSARSEPAPDLQLALGRVLRTSGRQSDPAHPVGAVAAVIRKALPDFQDWALDTGAAVARLFSTSVDSRGRAESVLPPGFAKGRPGAFLRATRAMVRLTETESFQSMYEHLQNSPDETAFRKLSNSARVSDALDLTWMVTGSLELRSVQELLERLSSVVLPGVETRFSPYDEPRYRSALQLHFGAVTARAAHGGVLAKWAGCPDGVGAAHVRIFLEPWATVQSGEPVELDQLS